MHEIEVIAKSGDKVYKIVNITRNEYDSMQKKKGFSYQPFQVGFSNYKEAIEINFKKQ